jgi:hypothetical protein
VAYRLSHFAFGDFPAFGCGQQGHDFFPFCHSRIKEITIGLERRWREKMLVDFPGNVLEPAPS